MMTAQIAQLHWAVATGGAHAKNQVDDAPAAWLDTAVYDISIPSS